MDKTLKILMMEDNATDAEIVQQLLKKEMPHFEFRLAMNKDAYIQALDEFKPDIILADYSLPQFTAKNALDIILWRSINIPFIIVSGAISEDFAIHIIKHGADDYILKDRLARLPAAIKNALEKRQSEKEKFEAHQKLIKSEKKYRSLFEQNVAGIYQTALDGRILTCNDAFVKIMGYDSQIELLGKNSEDFYFTDTDRDHFMSNLLQNGELKDWEMMLKIKDGNSKYIIMNCSLRKDLITNEAIIEGVLIDITERKKAEKELEESYQSVRKLTEYLLNIREEERTSIAREIHDELGQQLTIMKMDAFWLNKKVGAENNEIREKIQGLLEMIDDTIKSVRRISTDLRPSVLYDLGLAAAMEFHLKEFEKRSGIRTKFTEPETELQLPDHVKIALFRIFQESLTNVARHSGAKTVTIKLKMENKIIVLIIEDDGVGFDEKEVAAKRTLGVLGMKERAAGIGGEYIISGNPGIGTTIEVKIPLPDES